MRAPRHPQSCALTEAAMDDLAEKLGMDPLEFRLKNLARRLSIPAIYQAEVAMGAELIGWREKRKPRGKTGTGPIRTGMGMALHHGAAAASRASRSSAPSTPMARSSSRPPPRTSAPASARSWRSSPPRSSASSRPTSSAASAIRPTRRARPRAARPRRPSMSPPCYDAVTKARDALFKKIASAAEQRQARGPDAQGRPGLGLRRAGGLLEGRLPQARHLADLRDRLVRRGPHQHRRRRLPVRRGRRSTSRPAWSSSRRSSPSRTPG